MKKITTILLVTLGVLLSRPAFSQVKAPEAKYPVSSYKPLKLSLNEDGSKYVRFIIWNQVWMSSDLKTNGVNPETGVNLQMRRSRFLAYSQITPRFLILTHFGLNSLGASGLRAVPNGQPSNGASFFLHDAWSEFAVVEKKLHVGAGLHYWNGISRLTNQSTLNMMTLDNPGSGVADARLFPWATITTSDQFARHLGVYAKGDLGKLHYRIAANNARTNMASLDANTTSFQVPGSGKDWLYSGYFKYDVFDKESSKLPYLVGTYMGKKKVLSIGAGFNTFPNALKAGTVDSLGVITYTNEEAVSFAAADIFYDAPVGDKGHAVSALAAFYTSMYGENENFGGGGLIPGSGSILYTQLGYYIPKGEYGFMPYATFSNQNLSNTPNASTELGVGCNWFIHGHNAKVTAEYNTGTKGVDNAGTNSKLRLQLHIFL